MLKRFDGPVILRTILILVLAAAMASRCLAGTISPEAALNRLYNFDFTGAHQILSEWNRVHHEDPLGHALQAAAYLFTEFSRLQILDGEFFEDDKQIVSKKGLSYDPKTRDLFYAEIDKARRLAQQRLEKDPRDQNALFSYTVSQGLTADYISLVEKRGIASLTYSKEAQAYALRLLQVNPNYADAYLTTGFSEYLLGSLPFFVRWFVHFDDAKGDKQLAITRLEKVAREGRYLGPYARILLSIIYLREHQPARSEALLANLSREFPENPLMKKELGKVRVLVASAQK